MAGGQGSMKLSIFLAGIRTEKWSRLFKSISRTTSTIDYELIFVSPYDLPPKLAARGNVRLIKDFGCPTRCYQLGLMHSTGDYVVWPADDGVFSRTMAVDKAIARIKDRKDVVALKYFEGERNNKSIKQEREDWWHVGRHHMLKSCKYLPKHYYLIMNAVIRRDYFMEIGGWDCRFEHLGLGSVDLAARLQNDGANVILGEKFMDIAHLPGASGDHGPIFHAQTKNDSPLFEKMYNDPANANRAKIDFDNWKQAEAVWSRRF
jgi:hypothetical protein